jgi:hypothetical protein
METGSEVFPQKMDRDIDSNTAESLSLSARPIGDSLSDITKKETASQTINYPDCS